MIPFTAKIVQLPPTADKIYKNIKYGTAVGLTKTAKEGQAAVQSALRSKFTIRNRWLEQNTPVGIKIKPATKDDLQSIVRTAAKFLPLQDTGGIRLPYKNFIAVPAYNSPISKAKIIPTALRPKNLKKSFVLKTASGKQFLCIRQPKGKGAMSSLPRDATSRHTSGLVVMYQLIPKAKIKKADIFYDPIEKVVKNRLTSNISEQIDKALRTMH